MLNRADLRARVFPLAHEVREESAGYATPDQRLALVAELTREMWALSGRELPAYSRSEIPVQIFSRPKQGG